ncbi:PTS sugar transporter subunit IIA [Haloimpatiens massiliensis]|uniref:PTS sugar transporter subunit IIA n=1 Tax=Haloimpatiens massiliensis TaxID=1658110 RepID=UPI000C860B12|nr:PTS fructose transporter subunit IIA [Haloimpatiens massiliensis]
MKNIILVSHGTMAKGVYQAVNMIYGDLKNIKFLCLEENMGIDLFRKNLDKLMDGVKDSDEIIVLADLKGGSPYTSALTLLSEKGLIGKSKIVSGLNLPMILSALFFDDELGDDGVDEIMKSAKEGIIKFEMEESENEDL